MPRMSAVVFACAVTCLAVPRVHAQSKTIEGERTTTTATVEAIEKASRSVTLRNEKGELHTVNVASDIKAFDDLKIGDTVNATYYENIVLRVKQPGEPDVDTTSAGANKADGKPAGTAAVQRTITATIDNIDPAVPSISFKGPNGWNYSSKVHDKKALQQVKVGDRVDITWTTAMLVSVSPAKK